MAFLDKKERIIDVALTKEGRKLLAQNDLRFSYYSFSDDGIDYSGSMVAAKNKGEKFENYIPKENLFEAVSKNNSIKHHLFTIDPSLDTTPELKIQEEDINEDLQFTINRKYAIEKTLTQFAKQVSNNEYPNDPLAAIIRADTDEKESEQTRSVNKTIEEATINTINDIASGFINPGSIIGDRYIITNELEAIDKKTGVLINISDIDPYEETVDYNQLNGDIEVVLGIDTQEIGFFLKHENEVLSNNNGFLIEVYESGSDGRIEKLPAEDSYIEEEIQETKKLGFLNYMKIVVDEGSEEE